MTLKHAAVHFIHSFLHSFLASVEYRRRHKVSVPFSELLHRESKNKTPNSCSYLGQILVDFQNSFTLTLGRKFAIKRSLQISPHLKRRRYTTLWNTTLWNISFQKLHWLKAQQQQTKSAKCDRDWWTATKHLWRDKKLSFSTLQHNLRWYGSFSSLKNWLKQTAMLISSKQLLNDVIFIRFSHKSYSHYLNRKIHRMNDCKHVLQQRIKMSEQNAFAQEWRSVNRCDGVS